MTPDDLEENATLIQLISDFSQRKYESYACADRKAVVETKQWDETCGKIGHDLVALAILSVLIPQHWSSIVSSFSVI